MVAPTLPEELQRELDNIAGKYIICVHTQEYELALAIIKELYNKMLAWQQEYGERYHKGYPIHNIGYTLYRQNKTEDALKYFILAYIEDLLSADRVEEADATPAGQTLLLGYKYNPKLLEPLKQKVTELKKKGRIPLQPEQVIRELEESKTDYKDLQAKITVSPRSRKFTIFDSEWEKRVFIGGSGDPIIEEMRDIVEKIGSYDPVVAVDFDMPVGMTVYQKCLALLHCCKYAIFDLSKQAGQLIEVERAPDYRVKTLVVWPKDAERFITEMLKSCLEDRRIKYKSYTQFPELEGIFREFLQG